MIFAGYLSKKNVVSNIFSIVRFFQKYFYSVKKKKYCSPSKVGVVFEYAHK